LGKSFCSVKKVEVEEPKDFTELIAEKLKIDYSFKVIKKAKLKYFSYARINPIYNYSGIFDN
jgi:hypothetical protein